MSKGCQRGQHHPFASQVPRVNPLPICWPGLAWPKVSQRLGPARFQPAASRALRSSAPRRACGRVAPRNNGEVIGEATGESLWGCTGPMHHLRLRPLPGSDGNRGGQRSEPLDRCVRLTPRYTHAVRSTPFISGLVSGGVSVGIAGAFIRCRAIGVCGCAGTGAGAGRVSEVLDGTTRTLAHRTLHHHTKHTLHHLRAHTHRTYQNSLLITSFCVLIS